MPEKMEPITNPALVDAMATFKVDLSNKEHERTFLIEAVKAKYLLPAMIEQPAEPPKEGEQVQTRIAFQIMTNPKGDKFMPAFTDEIELRKNRKPGERFQVAVMSFMDLYRFVKSNEAINGVVINPFGSALCLVRAQMIAIGDNGGDIIVREQMQQKMQAEAAQQQIQLTPPERPNNALGAAENSREAQQDLIRQAMAELETDKEDANDAGETAEEESPISDDLVNAVKGVLKKQKLIKKAYMRPEKENGEKYILIALEGDESADIEAINSAVVEDCKDYVDLPLECVAANSIRAKELIAEEKPFYEKKRFGIF